MRALAVLLALLPASLAGQLCQKGSGTGSAFAYWTEHADTLVSRHTNLATALTAAEVVASQTGAPVYVRALFRVECPQPAPADTVVVPPPDTVVVPPPDTTATPDPDGWRTVFWDDFEGYGDLPAPARGGNDVFAWGGDSRVRVSDEWARSGEQALRFTFASGPVGTDAIAEQRFSVDPFPEVRLDFWLYVPDNYQHRRDGSANNKFFRFWNGNGWSLTSELETNADDYGASGFKRFLSESENCDGSTNWPSSTPSVRNVIGPGPQYAMQPGTWNHVDIRYRAAPSCPTPEDNDGGRIEVWINGALVHWIDRGFWARGPAGGMAEAGYLLGWANSGFNEDTVFFIDDFRLSLPSGAEQ